MVDLSPLSDPRLVPIALSSALGLKLPSENPHLALIAALRDKRTLLVLDTCEHVVAAVAALAEAVLRGAPGVRILATSREPLRAEGECIHRLPPLAEPLPLGPALRSRGATLSGHSAVCRTSRSKLGRV